MGVVPLDNIVEVAFRSTLTGGVEIANTFHLTVDSNQAGDPSVLQDIADALAASGTGSIRGAYAGLLLTGDLWHTINVAQKTIPNLAGDAGAVAQSHPNAAGTRSVSEDMPKELVVTLTEQTQLAGRRYRGRQFLPGPRTSAAVNGETVLLTNTYWTTLIPAYVTALGTLVAGSGHVGSGDLAAMNLAVFSTANYIATEGETYFQLVSALRANSKLHWLRSRAK